MSSELQDKLQDKPLSGLDLFLRVGQLVLALSLPVVGWIFAVVQDHEVRLVRIESSTLTATEIRLMEDRMRDPPQWLKEAIADLRQLVKSIETRMIVIEREVKKQ